MRNASQSRKTCVRQTFIKLRQMFIKLRQNVRHDVRLTWDTRHGHRTQCQQYIQQVDQVHAALITKFPDFCCNQTRE